MQIRKCLLAVCFAVASLSVQAADTEAQIKAREALQKKLQDIDAQAAVTNAAAPAQPVPPAAPAPAAAPAVTPAEPPPPQPAPAAAAAAAATAAAVPEAAPAAAPEMGGVPVAADPAVIEKAREAMHKKMDELAAQTPAEPAPVPPPMNPEPKTKVAVTPPPPPPKPPKSSDGLPPIPGPDLPISAEQQQQLSALLQRYKADEITPDQYQAERAKILQAKN